MKKDLLPPPPPPQARPEDKPVAPAQPFDIVVVVIAAATLLGILVFLFPRKRDAYVVDQAIRLDPVPATADAAPSEPSVPAATPAPSAVPASASPPSRSGAQNAGPVAAPQVEGPLSAGDVYEGTPTLVGKGKDTNGIPRMKVKDCMVYIRGATVGQKTRFRIVEARRSSYGDERPFYFAEAVSPDTPLTEPAVEPPAKSASDAAAETAPKVGEVYEDTPDRESKSRDRLGMPWMRVKGHVVFIRGAVVGQKTRFRIAESQPSAHGDGRPIFFADVVSPDTPLTGPSGTESAP